MSERTGMFLVFVGMVVAGLGCGGIENSMTNAEFLHSTVIGFVGVAIMWVGTLGIIRAD